MDKKEYTYLDSSNVEHVVSISKEDFKLNQKDKSIHDTKFKTKPTTFFKDALKRFTIPKSVISYARYRVRNGDALKRTAPAKSSISYACY